MRASFIHMYLFAVKSDKIRQIFHSNERLIEVKRYERRSDVLKNSHFAQNAWLLFRVRN